jgi:hypothetical protein
VGKNPAFQFYPSDWARDLEEHPLEIEGAWIRIICKLWWSETRGRLSKTIDQWSRILRTGTGHCTKILEYIKTEKIGEVRGDLSSCNGIVTVISRRMERDQKERESVRLRVEKLRHKELCNAYVTPDVTPMKQPSSSSVLLSSDLQDLNTLAESDEKTIASPPEEQARRPKIKKKTPLTHEEYCQKCRDEIPKALSDNREIWRQAYPGINLDQEAAKAVAWLLSHPKERKSLYPKFLNSWLSRAQENVRAAPQSSGNGGFSRGTYGTYKRPYSPRDAAKSAALDDAADQINREWRESKHSRPAQNPAHDHSEKDAQ